MDANAGTPAPRPRPVFADPDTGAVVSRHDEIGAVLADPRYAVRGAGESGPDGTLAWLRKTVSRFSEGTAHERRRAIAVGALTAMDPAALEAEAAERTRAALERAGGAPVDVMASLARQVPAAVLGAALGVTDLDALTEAVPVAAAGYLTGAEPGGAPDAAVAVLVRLLGPGDDETVANRIALLMQACDATAALIGTALAAALRLPDPYRWPARAIVTETLRFDPPVRAMRRVTTADVELYGHALPAGTAVTLDIAAANRDPEVFADPERFDPGRGEDAHLTFGAGRRPCPGAPQAVNLAAGVVDGVLRHGTPAAGTAVPAYGAPERLEVVGR